MNMKIYLLCLVGSSIQPAAFAYSSASTSSAVQNKDTIFNAWCSDVGIVCSGAEVRTTPESVAGRGVFTTKAINSGEEIISIPYHSALMQSTAGRYFPTLEQKLMKCRTSSSKQKLSLAKRISNRIRRRRRQSIDQEEKFAADDFWQAELTAYAKAALEIDHPLSPWIAQWTRDDPMQNLADNCSTGRYDDEAINSAVCDFQEMAPKISKYKLNAAVGIRLNELEEYSQRYESKVPTSNSLYTTLISRAVGISDSVTAVLPMHDMINHSCNPNVGVAFGEDGTFKIVALQDIPKDKELFISYRDIRDDAKNWDEDKAAWLLVQWGIPSSPSEPEQFWP